MVIKVSFVVELIVKKMFSFVFMGQPLDPISTSVLKCAFSLRHELQTPNEGINQRHLKNWADVADRKCFVCT